MPELPDVEVFKRYLVATSLRQRIGAVRVRSARVLGNVSAKTLAMRLAGRRFRSARRHGKHLYVELDQGPWLAMHFGMTGYLRYFKDTEPDPAYDRVVFDFANGHHLGYYSLRLLGRIDLVDDPAAAIAEAHLGPDALDPAFDLAAFKAVIGRSKGIIKSVLMNQGLVAGVGNIYADEILFQARVHPKARASALDERTLKVLYRAMRTVLKTAIARRADPDKLPRGYLIPRRTPGATCPRCGGKIKQLKISARSSYVCPCCQAMP